jgi:hypothetical protein
LGGSGESEELLKEFNVGGSLVGVTLSRGVLLGIVEVLLQDKLKKAILFRSDDHDINLFKDDLVAHLIYKNYVKILKFK